MTCSFGRCVSRSSYGIGRSILRLLVAGYVALLPYLFEVGQPTEFCPCRLFPAAGAPAGGCTVEVPQIGMDHLARWNPANLRLGSLVAALRFGELDRYELLNKDAGLLLPFLSYAAITSTVTEWEDLRRILRIFTLSVVVENLLAVGGFLAAYFLGVDDAVYTLRGPPALGDAAGSECLRRSSRGRPGDLRGSFVGPGAAVQATACFGFRGSLWHWEFCSPFRARHGWASAWLSCFSSRSGQRWRFDLCWLACRCSLSGPAHGTSLLAHSRRNGQPAETGPGAVRPHSPGPAGIRASSAARRRTRKLSLSGWRSCAQQRHVVSR